MTAATSIFSDLSGYVDRVAKLARLDAALLSIETKANLLSVGISVGVLAAAGLLAFLGVIILLFAAVLLLIQLGLSSTLSALLVAVALFVIAGGLALLGMQRLKHWSLMPHRALAQFAANLDALRTSIRNESNS